MGLAWCRHPEEGLPRPDACIFLDISAAEAAKRGGWGEERYENKELQDRVRELFDELQRAPESGDFVVIDAGRSVEEVEKSIMQAVDHVSSLVDSMDLPLRRVAPW